MNAKRGPVIRRTVTCLACWLAVVVGLTLCAPAMAAVPHVMTYQGFLTDSLDRPLTGDFGIVFGIYSDPTGGSPLWQESHVGSSAVHADAAGTIEALLGSLTPFPASLFTRDGPARYLQLTVNDETLLPRKLLSSVPYALVADSARADTSSVAFQHQVFLADNAGVNFTLPRGSLDSHILHFSNPQGLPDPDYNVEYGTFTPSVPGVYMVTFQAAMPAKRLPDWWQYNLRVEIWVNHQLLATGEGAASDGGFSGLEFASVSQVVSLRGGGDYVEFKCSALCSSPTTSEVPIIYGAPNLTFAQAFRVY
jgi:hypothetical protein